MPPPVSFPGEVLVMPSPYFPGVAVGPVAARVGDDGSAELPEQLGDGDGDEPWDAGAVVEGALAGGGDGEEGVGEQADRGPAVPGCPGGDLAAVQPADLLRLLVVFFSQPPLMPVKKKWSLSFRAHPGRY